ncbi:T9SS type A sorting domain-containing protein [Catalinimonas niigatensis]|uniref:T9SS type A sorting domain-containing protein n=1 Tax=Catalinimonas niigatensis TaxID=1397264 RepID=UPI002666ADFC|nr:T9SS type A sorting domain-containing protein [Catalinimonas niigatensis]WPP52475.1 T9SS type A sorting domain-containing protein [Catalinimonas niigatensis]
MKFFLPLIFFLYALSAYSQGFTLLNSQEEYFVQTGELHKSPLSIRNNSTKPLRLAVRVLDTDQETEELLASICADESCLDRSGLLEIKTLEPGELFEGLSFHLKTSFEEVQGNIRFLFFDTDNPSNAIERSFKFHVQGEFPSGIMYQRPDLKVSNAYPNPIANTATIDYSLGSANNNARIIILNILGNQVLEHELPSNESSIKIPTDQLTNGVYFYTLQLNGKNVATKKMVVRK